MLLYAGTGSQLGRSGAVGLLWTSKSTPLAFRGDDECEGFDVLWEATGEMEEVAKALDMDVMDEPGLWLLTALFTEAEYLASVEDESWDYLTANLECERIDTAHNLPDGALSGLCGWALA
jgi:hypothetical protein